ncbi:cysteine--tRNA ligase [Erysipelothrix rhusiopathiae]|uniref:cysteine--tRNA ligase n=1 Tax=Erysipelothrix rhusiopathiae TaxID=1648 RepID=UPI000F42E1FC|nr:cysteine--tRNA ligase [Erysipelothrix rhusiopathiae]AYV33987.1 cysteine--tRNA ligase [Erysipelothrix rhusiopathiae]MDE8081590.1 cysteine--tRNA ligase [Erysipelothrix rhusiopathiae]MDE8312320.1 cysteine--tRNA ligase [Erysipelothrix rhusiopathiae]MDE8317928.1 cysteine--tRNA ligase [Erysipelothrix rhusiopathiae]MDE8332203.1 cysteine--tRNA ligase [Erysipelothrix rhusiopathiae]
MKLYNSKSNSLEEFKPIEEGKVSMYVCGPTVYNYAHIGNARPIVVFDLLRRVLETLGYDVKFVSNYTDVDDKIIKKASEEGVDESVISNRYIEAYEKVRKGLHADHVQATPKVTNTMPEIIAFIQDLIDHDYAYASNGDVYFRVSKAKEYGAISSQNIDELMVGARIEENSNKENPLDFVLWKDTNDDGIKWDAPWGKGRPGWHTECVVMINNEFKQEIIDIHGGGQDLKFPHHENESAQCRALHNHDLANYWVHNAMLNIDGEKMSKSIGNVMWAQEFIDKLGENATRWLLLSTHYRLTLNITEELVEQTRKELDRIFQGLNKAYIELEKVEFQIDTNYDELRFNQFMDAMSDDLNVANANVVLFDTVKQLNAAVRQREIDASDVSKFIVSVEKMLDVLGISYTRIVLDEEARSLFTQWNEAKARKDFDDADRYRGELIERGLL